MDGSAAVHLVEDDRYRDHSGPDGHPERPERLLAVRQALAAHEADLVRLDARPAEPDEVLRVHDETHLRGLEAAAARAPTQLDADTYVSAASFEVALLAAGGAVTIAEAIVSGGAKHGLAAVRPPGHHAEAGHAMGFCLFNNVAVATRAVQASAGVGKVLILDWDVHHGNGTQHCFEDDPSVLYASLHQYPYYPGTGDAGEVGSGAGLGSTVNVPMPAGCGDAEYVGVLQRVVEPMARSFAPDLILVSCGFDAHRDDPLASMNVSAAGYYAMTQIVRGLADELCAGRLGFVLEGGYAASGLIEGTDAVLRGLLDEPNEAAGGVATPPLVDAPPGSALGSIVRRVAAVHGGRFEIAG